MKLLYRCCAGLNIHRDTVSARVRRRVRAQAEATIEEQVLGTFTQDLERLRSLLKKHGIRQVATMHNGSPGIYSTGCCAAASFHPRPSVTRLSLCACECISSKIAPE